MFLLLESTHSQNTRVVITFVLFCFDASLLRRAGKKIDFKLNRQSNVDTHGSRDIRRRLEAGSAWTCEVCSYHNDSSAVAACAMCERPRR